jgi:uncharacterized protein YdcH (DUF465 family)
MTPEERKAKVEHHITRLQEKHDELDKRIALDMEPEYILRVLKKEKLELKDDIVREKQKLTEWDNWKPNKSI